MHPETQDLPHLIAEIAMAAVALSGITMVPATSGVVLMSLNFWLASDWPYLTQLFVALITSMILFLGFIYQALADNND